MNNKRGNGGWPGERQRHAMSSRGILTARGRFSGRQLPMSISRDDKVYNVAGFVNGQWQWGSAIKAYDGTWRFLRDYAGESEDPVVLKPGQIKIQGVCPVHLAAKGYREGSMLRYDASGCVMPSEGITSWLGGVAKKFKDFGGKVKEKAVKVGVAIKEKAVKAKEFIKKKLTPKEAAQQKELEKVAEVTEQEELIETRAEIRDGPPDTPEEIDIRGRVKGLVDTLTQVKHKPSEEELMNVTDELLMSPDADAIIVIAEEKEKLANYTAELQRLIDLLEVEGRAKSDEYRNEEDYLYRKLKNDIRLMRANVRENQERIEVSGLPEAKAEHKIFELDNDLRMKERELEALYKDTRRQHEADLNHVENLVDNLEGIHDQVHKRFETMVAAGHQRP